METRDLICKVNYEITHSHDPIIVDVIIITKCIFNYISTYYTGYGNWI